MLDHGINQLMILQCYIDNHGPAAWTLLHVKWIQKSSSGVLTGMFGLPYQWDGMLKNYSYNSHLMCPAIFEDNRQVTPFAAWNHQLN